MNVIIREATKTDAPGMWRLIHELAVFERSGHEHTLTAEQLMKDIEKSHFTAFVAEKNEEILGLALMYPVYSTWKGRSWYLEDIVVVEKARRQGIGSMLFTKVCKFASLQNAGRLSWQVLEWNEPAIQFYKKYGAELDTEWITCRIRGEVLKSNEFN
jgi:ribosomal protein S18 acetylase RimI-like enzyme